MCMQSLITMNSLSLIVFHELAITIKDSTIAYIVSLLYISVFYVGHIAVFIPAYMSNLQIYSYAHLTHGWALRYHYFLSPSYLFCCTGCALF